MKELEKVLKCKEVSLETKVKFIYTSVFQITMYGYESWILEKWEGKIA